MSTKIEWATETWNPVTGCTPISEGCQNCYAKRMANRLRGRCGYPADDPFRVTFHPDRLEQPLKWKKPRKIFVCSMGDLFHREVVAEGTIMKIFYTMMDAGQHQYLLLTKRPRHMRLALDCFFDGSQPPENWWLGVTAENQKCADARIPVLLQIPAAVKFVSVEPMLGYVDLERLCYENGVCEIDALHGSHGVIRPHRGSNTSLDWVICGGETGPGARPMKKEWVYGLRDQCVNADVPFFFKKWGPDGRRDIDGEMWEQWPERGKCER